MGQQQKNKMVLLTKYQNIIVHKNFKMNLEIGCLDTFPHGLDGLRLWQAGIILSRYIIHNSSIFKGKLVLELGGGVGIAGFTAKKWTECEQVHITDYQAKVVKNIQSNMKRNKVECQVYQLDWTKRQENPKQFDIIMGSDVVYFGCPVADLYTVFKQKLKVGGIGIIIIPVRKNYAQLFLQKVQKDIFDLTKQKLQNPQYFQNPLQNEAEGLKSYPLLKQIDFEVYKLTKKK